MDLEIIFPTSQWTTLRDHLFGQAGHQSSRTCAEQMALVLAAPNASSEVTRLVVRDLLPAEPADLAYQSTDGIEPKGEFVAAALTRCRQQGWSLIEVHSHPSSNEGFTTFSHIDWSNDQLKMPAMTHLLSKQAFHATMVVGRTSLDAHYYERASSGIQPVRRVSIIGASHGGAGALTYISPTSLRATERSTLLQDRYSRQIPLLGSWTQELLARSTIVVVGLGGLGSLVAMEFAHLGAGSLVLIDPDVVESSNLNRLIGATERDIGRSKADLYASLVSAVAPSCNSKPVPASILSEEALKAARQADVILACVDSDGARLVINQLAVQYLIPLIDGGTGARLDAQQEVTHAGGQVQVVLPGLGCLACRGFIDARQAALDLAPTHIRHREHEHGYGTRETAPAVIFLNGVVASLQVAEAVKLLSGSVSRNPPSGVSAITFYDLLNQSMTRATVKETDTCPTCGPDGVRALADLSPLYHASALPVPQPTPLGIFRSQAAKSESP